MKRQITYALTVALLVASTSPAWAEGGRVALADHAIALPQPVYFESSTATIDQRSFAMLDHVVAVLRAHGTVTIEVQAHSDSRGSDGWNLRLTQVRAQAIRDYLVSRGIPQSRIEARGYGETCPIDTNRTAAGRERNRRVEIVRTDRPGPRTCALPPPPPAPPVDPLDEVEPDQYQQ